MTPIEEGIRRQLALVARAIEYHNEQAIRAQRRYDELLDQLDTIRKANGHAAIRRTSSRKHDADAGMESGDATRDTIDGNPSGTHP